MKCLMIKPQFLAAILSGEKTIEYRTWSTKHRGDILLGCTATSASNAFVAGVACVDDVTDDDGVFAWHLSNVRAIKPLQIRGQLRLFESGIDCYDVIDGDDEDAVNAAYDEAAWIEKGKGVK